MKIILKILTVIVILAIIVGSALVVYMLPQRLRVQMMLQGVNEAGEEVVVSSVELDITWRRQLTTPPHFEGILYHGGPAIDIEGLATLDEAGNLCLRAVSADASYELTFNETGSVFTFTEAGGSPAAGYANSSHLLEPLRESVSVWYDVYKKLTGSDFVDFAVVR